MAAKSNRMSALMADGSELEHSKLSIVDDGIQEERSGLMESKASSGEYKQVNIRLTREEYENYSRMFGSCGITNFSQAVRIWLDFAYQELKLKNYTMSKSGIRENRLK